MARPLSDEKRQALIDAAIETVAAHGTGAPTAKIAKLAGVAEGTLFKYFANKDELLNAVYVQLKADLRAALLADFPEKGSVKNRSRHVWTRYVDWGAARPAHRKAVQQLAVSDVVTEQSRHTASEGFEAFRDLIRNWSGLCNPAWKFKSEGAFASAVMTVIADTTIDFIIREPRRAKEYADAGFEAFWRAAAG